MARSNCLFFAIALWWRRQRRGKRGYILIRRSVWGRFPHFMYGRVRVYGGVQLVGYVPADPRLKTCPPPIFVGRVQWGDPAYMDSQR